MSKRKPGPASGLFTSKRYSLTFIWIAACAAQSGAFLYMRQVWPALAALSLAAPVLCCYVLSQTIEDTFGSRGGERS